MLRVSGEEGGFATDCELGNLTTFVSSSRPYHDVDLAARRRCTDRASLALHLEPDFEARRILGEEYLVTEYVRFVRC